MGLNLQKWISSVDAVASRIVSFSQKSLWYEYNHLEGKMTG